MAGGIFALIFKKGSEIWEARNFLNICKYKVADYFNSHKDKSDALEDMTFDQVYVVWYCKTLQNHKLCLVRR